MENNKCKNKAEVAIPWAIKIMERNLGISLQKYKTSNKRLMLRNCVNPKLAKHIFQEAYREYKTLFR